MSNQHYIFVDESGDPGKPFEIDAGGNKIPTGSSLFYIISAVCLDSIKLFALEQRFLKIKNDFEYRKEIKSSEISLPLHEKLLTVVNETSTILLKLSSLQLKNAAHWKVKSS